MHTSDPLLDVLSSDNPEFEDLDALLASSLKLKRDAVQVKAARKVAANPKTDPSVRKEIETKVAEWELQREWLAVADVAYFQVQYCSHCGSTHHQYAGEFQRQKHRTYASDRWIRSDAIANRGLPKETKTEEANVKMCSNCCWEQGFKL
jgi:hypothetical protein